MEFPIKFDTVKSGWSIVYMEGSMVVILKNIYVFFSEHFVLANSEDPDEKLHNAAFHQGLHCLQKCWFESLWSSKG